MKKTYINPTIYTRKVVVNNILAGSPNLLQTLSSSPAAENEDDTDDGTIMEGKSSFGDFTDEE